MDLQPEAHAQFILENPLRQLSRIDEAVGGIARAACLLAESGRKDDIAGLLPKLVADGELAREFVIGPRGNDKFEFIAPR